MAGLVWWVSPRQVRPLGSGAQNPEDTIQHLAAAAPGPPTTVGASRHFADERLDHRPLLVRYVHGCCILLLDAAYHLFMRWLVISLTAASCLQSGMSTLMTAYTRATE